LTYCMLYVSLGPIDGTRSSAQNRLGRTVEQLERMLVTVNRGLVAMTLAVIFAIVFANVVGRYVFGSSFAWVEETARHLMVFCAFAGAGLALREGRLVAIEVLQYMLPPKAGLWLRWFTVLVMAVFMAAMVWLGIKFVAFGWPKETMSTGISRGIPYLSIPLGAGLFLIHLAFFARRFVARAYDFDELDEPERDAV